MDRRPILILDEHRGSRIILAHALSACGHICICVPNVPAALTVFDELAPDKLIYEWSLRSGGSAGLARTLRQRAAEHQRSMLIVVVSALDEPRDFRHAEDIDAYFTKPLDVQDFIAALCEIDATRRVIV